MDLNIYIHSSKISFRQSDQSIDECLNQNKSFFTEESNFDHWHFNGDHKKVILIPKDFHIKFNTQDSNVCILDYTGLLDLEGSSSKVSIVKGKIQSHLNLTDCQLFAENVSGSLQGQLSKSKIFLSSNLQEINLRLDSSSSDILVNQSEFANCTLDGQDSSAIFKVLDLDDLVLQSQFPEKSVHGKNSKYFVSITGRFNQVEWKLNSEEWQEKTEDLKVVGQETIDKNDDIMDLFNQFEDKIEANYEVFSKEDDKDQQVTQASETVQANNIDEEHIYELYRNKEISFEELQDMLEKGM
ncbi:MAG: hypothetical protein KC646_00380 [Candidatus Cloacimonetes bacterium]|nr:hypothetical protein [Candidatus Cloacimonadota bacterium]